MHKVLLLSQRQIARLAAYCLTYEFEDVWTAVTGAQRIDVTDRSGLEFSRRAYKLARMTTGSPGLARRLAPYPREKVVLTQDYDVFFPVFSHTYELYALEMIPNWRQRCRKSACFIAEVWSERLPEYLLELLSGFDHVFIGHSNAVEDMARISGRPCTYLPIAADVLRFTPASADQPRPIDVCNIGRRSPTTHRALLDDAERRQTFYYYDTVAASGSDLKDRTFRVDNAAEHRRMLASILSRSRYSFAHRGFVNRPEFTAGREEISARYYEGAAAGTVIIGDAPRSQEFKRQFDWPDAVIHAPFDSPDIADILARLDSDPERLLAVRRNNIRMTAAKHDWLHRIMTVFDVLGLQPTEAMQARARRLDEIVRRTTVPAAAIRQERAR